MDLVITRIERLKVEGSFTPQSNLLFAIHALYLIPYASELPSHEHYLTLHPNEQLSRHTKKEPPQRYRQP